MLSSDFIFWVHVFCSLWMTSLIWVIQILHYPSFLFIDKNKNIAFSQFHQKRISLLVIPFMILELVSLVYLIIKFPLKIEYHVLGLLLGLIWISTFLLQVPCHHELSKGNIIVIDKLIKTNWIRTIAWSIKTSLVIILLI